MDSLTHVIVGLGIAALCGEPLSIQNPAAVGCLIGAVIPDGDIIMQFKGDYAYLKHHRGASHSLPAAAVFTAGIAGALGLVFGQMTWSKVLLMTLLGCLSHIFLDITNSYGAEALWPVYRKKIALDLLLIYDPVLVALSVLPMIPAVKGRVPSYMIVALFILYLIGRALMRHIATKVVYRQLKYKYRIQYLRVIPSQLNLIKWHFILMTETEKIIGEVNMFPSTFKVIRQMKEIDNKLYKMALNTPIAKFFKEFTPLFHIECKQKEECYIFEFTDLRYYMAKDFLHHATAILNKDFQIVESLFQPYKRNNNVSV